MAAHLSAEGGGGGGAAAELLPHALRPIGHPLSFSFHDVSHFFTALLSGSTAIYLQFKLLLLLLLL